jgi:hypothetical protein
MANLARLIASWRDARQIHTTLPQPSTARFTRERGSAEIIGRVRNQNKVRSPVFVWRKVRTAVRGASEFI